MMRAAAIIVALFTGQASSSAADFSTCLARIDARIAEEIAAADIGTRVYVNTPESDRSPEEIAQVERAMAIMSDRNRKVSAIDLAIIDVADQMLANEADWDRADDRQCQSETGQMSLYCVLQSASVIVMGDYQHRRTALQEIRFIIDARSEGRDYAHRLRDYNNDSRTTLDDIRSLFAEARAVVATRLRQQAIDCQNDD